MDNKQVLIIIPAFNEEDNIAKTIMHLLEHMPDAEYIVVNDGSTDATSKICHQKGYPCIDLPINVGLSHAIKCGMVYAYRNGYRYAVQFDADGQHDASYIVPLAQMAQQEDCDIVIGSRFLNKKMPFTMRMMGSRMIIGLIRLVSGQRLCDPTSGLRIYNEKMIRLFATMSNMNPEPDTVSFLIKCGAKVREIPVEMHDRVAGKSMFSVISSMEYMTKMIFALCFVQMFRRKDALL